MENKTLNLNLKNQLNFGKTDLRAPISVIREICSQLEEETEHCIVGVVSEYDGPIESYRQSQGLNAVAEALTRTKTIDIQKSLGKIGDEQKHFEFYLQTPVYEHYKYRIMFIEYGVGHYPVKLVLEEDISNELDESEYTVICRSAEELRQLVYTVLASQKVIDVMQELINIKFIKEAENLPIIE